MKPILLSVALTAIILSSCKNNSGNNFYNIEEFGAVGDGITLNTEAIQTAIDAASETGGTIVVPKGNFVSGTIFLKSNTTLEIQALGKIVASPDISHYTTMNWGHHEDRTPWHLIVAKGQKNIRITGTGTIDGNGTAYWEKERKDTFSFYKEIEYRPSPLVEIQECHDIIIENIYLVNSPGWTLHIYNCDVTKINKITIDNNLHGPNSDGIDVTGSHDVIISNCYISAGDDAIALKTTEDSRTCERVAITNCIFQTNCVALRVGFESRKDFRDISMYNCIVKNASRAIDIRTVEGGNIENVIVSGLTGQVNSGWAMDRVIEIDANIKNTPYSINIKEHPNYGKEKPVDKAGSIKNIILENIAVRTSGRIIFGARPETTIQHVTLRNITLDYFLLEDPRELGLKAENSTGFSNGLPFVRSQRAALVAENIDGLTITNVAINWPVFPVSDECKLLSSNNRLYNPGFFQGNEEKIKSGAMRVTFKAFAFKDVKDCTISDCRLTDSEKSPNFFLLVNSEVSIDKE